MGKQQVKIKLSSSFLSRTKCVYCGDYSKFAWKLRNLAVFKTHTTALTIVNIYSRDCYDRMCSSYYLQYDPSEFKRMGTFDFSVKFKSFNPKLHILRNYNAKNDFTDFVGCKCGRTEWAFNYASCETQPAMNKRSSNIYPNRFIY